MQADTLPAESPGKLSLSLGSAINILCKLVVFQSLSRVQLFVTPWTAMKEETDRTGSTLKPGLRLGLDCGL